MEMFVRKRTTKVADMFTLALFELILFCKSDMHIMIEEEDSRHTRVCRHVTMAANRRVKTNLAMFQVVHGVVCPCSHAGYQDVAIPSWFSPVACIKQTNFTFSYLPYVYLKIR